ncbi:uncharacterized protein F4812DRAFT_176736 [Daldinia caldariorum]|uniref:uncharacterized protein n=1 Tax=Daldinia caldariorum TaxID=326644 RepID=UPI0020073FFF|nr:uncharacterized protein F4812DRAFT_176736 [Daldinia caldariorum]KAI1471377.1 hypothetical protein F4812DRAFT_176736 [Daldinia caldariorum]
MKAEFQNWWRSQTVHPSRLQPTVPICSCAACFNGTGHGQEVFRDPIDPGEVLPPRTNTSAAILEKPKKDMSKIEAVKKPWYKRATSLSRKPSMASVASDLVPLRSTPTTQSTATQRVSSETRA